MMWTVVGRPRPLLPSHGLSHNQGGASLYTSFGFRASCLSYSTEEALNIMGRCCSVSRAEPEKVMKFAPAEVISDSPGWFHPQSLMLLWKL